VYGRWKYQIIILSRKSSTPTRRITPTPARARRNSSNAFNSFTFENSFESERSFSTEKLKRHKHGNNSASPKNARKASAKLKLEDFMQQGSRNRTPARCNQRENAEDVNISSSSDMDRSVLDISESNTANCINASTDERILPKLDLVTECNVLQRLAEIHSFCILGKYFLKCFVPWKKPCLFGKALDP
jgi:uncharacterized protein (DUF885 family)